MKTPRLAQREFLINTLVKCAENKDVITGTFPIKKSRWLDIVAGETITMQEIKDIANYCKCDMSDLMFASDKVETLSEGLINKCNSFYEDDSNIKEFNRFMEVLTNAEEKS